VGNVLDVHSYPMDMVDCPVKTCKKQGTGGKGIGCPQLSYGQGGQSCVDIVFWWQTWTCV